MKIKTIAWQRNKIKIIDQTRLPNKMKYIYITDIGQLFHSIKSMKIRGAPALAAAGALGVVLSAQKSRLNNARLLKKHLEKTINYLSRSRPTAVNLFWALGRMRNVLNIHKADTPEAIRKALFEEASKIIEEDRISCRKMAKFGSRLIKNGDSILTICNAGILATIDFGTALGVIYQAKKEGKKFSVVACETRPLLQGARLTAWELKKKGINFFLIFDSLAANLMREGKISKVLVGADRVAKNADVANKVGTYSLAVLAKWHNIPFYVVAPLSTFDAKAKTGRDIPIEQRSPREVTHNFFKKPIAPSGTKVINPAFDITPHQLITAIITEKGILRPPFRDTSFAIRGPVLSPIREVSPKIK